MTQMILQSEAPFSDAPCGLCGQPTTAPPGVQLVLAGTAAPVCQACGHKHAPALAALVHLADVAQRVTRIGRHSVFPPLTALLELASAAEKYCSPLPPPPLKPPTAATG